MPTSGHKNSDVYRAKRHKKSGTPPLFCPAAPSETLMGNQSAICCVEVENCTDRSDSVQLLSVQFSTPTQQKHYNYTAAVL
jgi:hypothetical protein